jgi:hypothetical protein
MGAVFADRSGGREREGPSWIPPPPLPPRAKASPTPTEPVVAEEMILAEPGAFHTGEGSPIARPEGRPFDAELDVAEVDERGRPGQAWTVRSRRLSRSNLVLLSRKLCYPGRELLVAVHLIDADPVPLFGRVHSCDYDGEGRYVVDLDLQPVPARPNFRNWIESRARPTR